MDFTGVFTYNMENLVLSEPVNTALFFVVAVLFLVVHLIAKYIFLYFAGFYMILEEKKKISNRKKVLGDLILMKDIQTELEKEIEQATLKAAFQN